MIKLELPVEEVQIILVGLSKLPYEAVSGIIDKVKAQATAQLQPPEQQSDPSVDC
jgi:hypothetical protein